MSRILDWLVAWLFRWLPRSAPTGLFSIGNPDADSPVIVTGNFALSVKRVRKALRGRDAWLLVAHSGGINVWCAADGGLLPHHHVIEATQVDVGQVTSTGQEAPKSADAKSKTTKSARKRTTKTKRRASKKSAGGGATKRASQDTLADAPKTAGGGQPTKRPTAPGEKPQPPMPPGSAAPESNAADLAGKATAAPDDSQPRRKPSRPARKRGGAASRRRKAKGASVAGQSEQQADPSPVPTESRKPGGQNDQSHRVDQEPPSTSAKPIEA